MTGVWLLPGLPLASAVLLALGGSRLSRRAIGLVGTGSVGLAFAWALFLAAGSLIAAHPVEGATEVLWTWFDVGGLAPRIALRLDALAVVITLVVTGVGFLIHVYSVEFMADEEDLSRFFASMNLFVGSMLVLVLADDLLLLYLGWEGVGLCSYLLIGFWYRDPANGRAARKAFLVTRVGDTALIIGLFLVVSHLGTLDLPLLLERAREAWAPGDAAAVAVAALLLGGAVGKSAQLPLQVWLPDAMAGPTPVSALIHAATMVTAGVYLIARTHPLFLLAPTVLAAVAVIGALTLLLAGASALVQRDIKRVLAWSTISQLGYMFLALGVGAFSAAIFHLVTHAFFKALLFLGAGAVILALDHEHDVAAMGGLARRLPVTFWTFLAGAAALAGLPLVTAGFYSKDLILWRAWSSPSGGAWLWSAGLAGALLTSLYVFRLVFLVFLGAPGEGPVPERGPGWRMAVPLALLAALSLVGGFVETPQTLGGVSFFTGFLDPIFAGAEHGAPHVHEAREELLLQVAAAAASLLGLLLAWLAYQRPRSRRGTRDERADRVPFVPAPVVAFWRRGWDFDRYYDALFVRPFVALAAANRADVVDHLPRTVAAAARAGHAVLRRAQTGSLRWYAAAVGLGAVLLLAVVRLVR